MSGPSKPPSKPGPVSYTHLDVYKRQELTEGMTDTLAACTKGANNKQKSRQSNGARAKSRAYCFKQSFMTSLLQNYASDVHETTSLIKDIKQLQNRSCDSIILDYFNPFKGKSFTEIAEQFHFTIPKNASPKQTNFMLVEHMLSLIHIFSRSRIRRSIWARAWLSDSLRACARSSR